MLERQKRSGFEGTLTPPRFMGRMPTPVENSEAVMFANLQRATCLRLSMLQKFFTEELS